MLYYIILDFIKFHFTISYYIIWYPNFGWESFSHVFFSTICLIMIPMTSKCLGLVAQPASSMPWYPGEFHSNPMESRRVFNQDCQICESPAASLTDGSDWAHLGFKRDAEEGKSEGRAASDTRVGL
jgi:hypothetical protein